AKLRRFQNRKRRQRRSVPECLSGRSVVEFIVVVWVFAGASLNFRSSAPTASPALLALLNCRSAAAVEVEMASLASIVSFAPDPFTGFSMDVMMAEDKSMEPRQASVPPGVEWWHSGRSWCFALVLEGSGYFFQQGSAFEVSSGQVLVFPMEGRYSIRASQLCE